MSLFQKMLVAIIILVFLFFAVFSGYNFYKKDSLESYNANVIEIQRDLAVKLSPLSDVFKQTELTPQSSKQLGPKLKAAGLAVIKAKDEINKLNPPQNYKKDHILLIKRLDLAQKTYHDLYLFSDYLNKRDKYLNNIVKTLKIFNISINKVSSNEDVLKLCKLTSTNLDKQTKKLKEIKTSQKLIRNDLLYKYVNELEDNLKKLSQSINEKDGVKFNNAIMGLQDSYNKNWMKAFLEADVKELKRLQRDIDKLGN